MKNNLEKLKEEIIIPNIVEFVEDIKEGVLETWIDNFAELILEEIKSQKELSYNQGAEEARAYYYERVRREAIKETLEKIKLKKKNYNKKFV